MSKLAAKDYFKKIRVVSELDQNLVPLVKLHHDFGDEALEEFAGASFLIGVF